MMPHASSFAEAAGCTSACAPGWSSETRPARLGFLSSVYELPVGTVTFLFTDVEGSTRLLKLWREQYVTALEEHQRILRAVFAEHVGHEIDTQGDSFFVAFRRAKDAVATAVEGQRRLAEQGWPDGAQLRVRMGIHTGEPAASGEGYVGLGVHRAARICAAGHGGQVLVSQATRELLRDDPLPAVSLRDLGEHQLRDMDEPERLYQLDAPGLQETFPPLKSATAVPFEGREGELAEAAVDELTKWRRRPNRRLLVAATFAAAVVGSGLGVVLTQGGGSTANASVNANSVGVIDSHGRVASAIAVGASPGGVTAGEGAIWVANTDANSVSRIDPRTNTVSQVIQVGGGPAAVAAGGGAVWVTNGLDGTVSRIDSTTNRRVQTIPVGNGPVGIAYGEGAVWVVNSVDGTVSRINPGSGVRTATVPAVAGATGVAFGFGRVWVVSPSAGVVIALDPTSLDVVDKIGVGVDPAAIAAGAGAVWVANHADGTVSRIDPRSPAHVTVGIPVGRGPDSIVVAAPKAVWVANRTDGTVMRIDASRNRVVRTVSLTNPPQGLAVSSGSLYVSVRSSGLEHRGGTLRVVGAPPDFIDPARAFSSQAWAILSMTNDGLVGFRRVGGIEGVRLVPDLAASMPAPTIDGKSYTFRLRAGVRYSTGQFVHPEDFRAEIERVFELAKPASPGRGYYSAIVGTERCQPGRHCDLARGIVTDPVARTVTFHLRAPDADFLTKLALPWAAAVPAGPGRDVNRGVAATGPYMVTAYRKNRLLRLVRNPMFREWSADAQPDGYPDAITWKFVSTPSSLPKLRAVEQRQADIAPNLLAPTLPNAVLADLATRYPAQLHFSSIGSTHFFFLNTRVAPFDDLRIRRAVNDAFDRQAYARLLGLGHQPTCQILPPNFPGYRHTCPYGNGGGTALARARQIVRSSGRSGMRVAVWTPSPLATETRFLVTLLNALGFRARLNSVAVIPDESAYFNRILDSRTRAQAGWYGWLADYPSDGGFLPPLASCKSTADPSEFCDAAIDRLLSAASAAQSQNPAAAVVLWQKVERAILAKAPFVPTYNPQDVSFVSKRVGNFQYNPEWQVLLDQLWIK